MAREERRRVSKDAVRENAKKEGGGGGGNWFNLPDGVRMWSPDKAGTYPMDILPYEVKAERHPDGIDKGMLWYKYKFGVHHGVGAANESLICPRTKGYVCTRCDKKDDLAKEYDKNKAVIDKLKPQYYVAFNIVDPDDKDKVAVYCVSQGKFWAADAGLKKEIDEGSEDNLSFYDVTDEGRTLMVRISDSEFTNAEGSKGKFLECTRIDFKPRPAMDEEEVLAKTVCFEEVIKVLPADKFRAIDLMLDEGAQARADAKAEAKGGGKAPPPAQAPAVAAPKPQQTAKKPQAAAAPATATAGTFKVGDRVKYEDDEGEEGTGTITEIDDTDVTVKGDDGKDHDCELEDIEQAPAQEKPKAEKKTDKKAPAAAPAVPVGKSSAKFKVGDWIQDEDDTDDCGELIEVDEKGKLYTVRKADGTKAKIDFSDAVVATKPEPEGGEEGSDAGEPWTPAVGDKVTWDNGTESGTILKIKGQEAKVENSDGSGKELVALIDLSLATE